MAFAFPKISKKKLKPKSKSKPSYSPQTEQNITLAMTNLALKGPRWIGEQMGADLDEAFEIGKTRVSLAKLIRHPVKTVKKLAKSWTISSWKKNLRAELVAEYVWEPRLAGMIELEQKGRETLEDAMRKETDPARWREMREELRQLPSTYSESEKAVLDWVSRPESFKKDVAFEGLEELRSQGNIGDAVWQGVERQHQWDEFARFRQRPGKYLWEKVAGKRGEKRIGPLYKYTPKKWLGEPLGKALGKTAFGKVVARIKKQARAVMVKVVDAGKNVVRVAVKAVAKVAKKAITKIAGQATVTAISSAIGGVIGSAGGPVGTVIGFLAGPIVTKMLSWLLKIACAACGCAAVVFVGFFAFVMVVIFGAFRPPDTGGMGPEQLVQVVKTVSPTHIDLGAVWPDTQASYTITVTNKTDKEITDGILVDTHKPADFNANTLSGGNWDSATGTLTWSGITIPPNDSFSVRPKGEILNTGVDKVVTNTVRFAGTIEGDEVSDAAMASVIVGEPVGQPPSGWPTGQGCISQGFNTGGTHSHSSKDVIDIAGTTNQAIYATHDGVAYIGNDPTRAGKYVRVVSEISGFSTFYAHLVSHTVESGDEVALGQLLGGMGATGNTDGGVHVHYEVKKDGALVTSQYIPSNFFDGCVDTQAAGGNCDCCFIGQESPCEGSAP